MPVSETVLNAMRQTNAIYDAEVVRNCNTDALDKVYTANARILPPGAPMVHGRAAIKSFWREALASLGVVDSKLATVEAEPCGDSVLEIGKADLTVANNQIVEVKYVVHWKQEDGRWKWHVDIWNLNQ